MPNKNINKVSKDFTDKSGFRLRLIPITLFACLLFVLFKVDDIATNQKYLARGVLPPAYAEDDAESEEDKEEMKDEGDEKDSEPSEESEDSEEESEEGEEKPAEPENENVSLTPPENVIDVNSRFNEIEVDLLESLSKRREEIEAYAEEVAMREKLLDATELRIDEKIKKMDVINKKLQDLLTKNKEQENVEMRSLVKIYENMKPKDAARIFNELDMNIMLDVIDMMSERKAAPIFANMDPKKAKNLTVKMAEMRQLRYKASKGLQGVDEAQ